MVEDENTQRTPGRRQPCCISMANAVRCQYIKRGFLWHRDGLPTWIPWSFNLSGNGWREVSPIRYCPFSGHNLDEPEE